MTQLGRIAASPRYWEVRVRQALMALMLSAAFGCGDSLQDPSTISEPAGKSQGEACSQVCILIDDATAFDFAGMKGDTSANVHIASVKVAGGEGGDVVLQLSGDEAALNAIPDAEALIVTINGNTQRFSLQSLRSPMVILTFTPKSSTQLDYALSRHMTAPLRGAIRLEQRLEGGSVAEASRQWIRGAALTPALTSLNSAMATCLITSSSTACGSDPVTTATASPYSQGSAWGPNTFSSKNFSDASDVITISFSGPVREFHITVLDPDYAGNRIIAYDELGGVVASADVPGDGRPGVLTTYSTILLGEGIRTVRLIPAPLDYVAYSDAYFAAGPSIAVDCVPLPATRGETVTCTASLEEGATGTLAITGWSFASSDFSVSVDEQLASTTWSGPAVIGGAVTARGTINGETSTGRGALAVSVREWANKVAHREAIEVPSTLTLFPDSLARLGNSGSVIEAYLAEPERYSEVQAGPNKGVYFALDVLVNVKTRIQINRAAMAEGSAFWEKQSKRRTGNWCSRADVVAFVPVVERHEGLQFEESSHAKLFADAVDRVIGPMVEGVIAMNSDGLGAKARDAGQNALADGQEASKLADQPPLAPQMPCKFRYF
jgi:hypothetical protein